MSLVRDIPSFQAEFLRSDAHLNKIVREFCFSGRLREAIRLLWCARLQFYPETYSLLLQECIHRKQYKWGKIIHTHMVVYGFIGNEYLITKLLIMYSKAGDLQTASILFHVLPNTNLISWNAIISGNVQNGYPENSLRLYSEMRRVGLAPDQYTFSSIFRACATLAILEKGKQAHCVFLKSKISENVVVNSALMDMYFKCSSPNEGHLVFEKSLERNVITWTGLISGYGYNGRVEEVLKFFHKMINEGFKPNYVTFLAVLSACSHGGLVEKARKYFSSMINDYNIRPIGKHYAAIVDLLGRSGRLEEAYNFVKNSPSKEHSVIWGALLGACRTHGNMDLLKLSAKKYFELEPENAGKYVVLCNAYAAFGLWDNVAEMRWQMKECGMKKEPGYSMIEVQRELHFFFMGDNCHEQTEEIHKLVKDMLCVLNDVDYVLDNAIFEDV